MKCLVEEEEFQTVKTSKCKSKNAKPMGQSTVNQKCQIKKAK
jgi:hypothetical protein